MKNLAKLSEMLRESRRALGLTRTEVAKRAGISVSHLWVLEGGKNPKTGKQSTPSFGVSRKLAGVLGIDEKVMLGLAGYDEVAQSTVGVRRSALAPEDLLDEVTQESQLVKQTLRLMMDDSKAREELAKAILETIRRWLNESHE